jgi:hypothetical protein
MWKRHSEVRIVFAEMSAMMVKKSLVWLAEAMCEFLSSPYYLCNRREERPTVGIEREPSVEGLK